MNIQSGRAYRPDFFFEKHEKEVITLFYGSNPFTSTITCCLFRVPKQKKLHK